METREKIVQAGVIEVGSTAVRMTAAQGNAGVFEILSQLSLPVSLGYDSFTREILSRETIEQSVEAVLKFRRVLTREFGLDAGEIRLVATSAVREARNREQFVDRVYIATGLRTEVLDETEVSRLTYLAVRPHLRKMPFFGKSTTLITDVGGGSTEILLFRRGRIEGSHIYRLGSLRMLRELGRFQGGGGSAVPMLRDYIAQTTEQILDMVPDRKQPNLIALGAEAGLLCCRLAGRKAGEDLFPFTLKLADLDRVTSELLALPVEEIAADYEIAAREAEILTPALFILGEIAKVLRVSQLLVAQASLRQGMMTERFQGRGLVHEFERQTISSATALARHFRVDLPHARRVAAYSANLLRFLLGQNIPFAQSDQNILGVASLLHESGMLINARAFHKHSFYIIKNSDIFGLSSYDTMLAACVARYHRRTSPRATHDEYLSLPAQDRIRVAKLAAILRLANCLDVDHSGPPLAMSLDLRRKNLLIRLHTREDASLAGRQIGWSGEMFQDVYGLRVQLTTDAT